jgi:hypothetical protein
MIVKILANGTAILEEAGDFSRFHVDAAARVDVDAALRNCGAGHNADASDEAVIAVSWVRSACGALTADANWSEGFQRMLEYAKSMGWLHDDAISAHIVRS